MSASGLLAGKLVGLSLGSTTLLGVLAASASYFAAPMALTPRCARTEHSVTETALNFRYVFSDLTTRARGS